MGVHYRKNEAVGSGAAERAELLYDKYVLTHICCRLCGKCACCTAAANNDFGFGKHGKLGIVHFVSPFCKKNFICLSLRGTLPRL